MKNVSADLCAASCVTLPGERMIVGRAVDVEVSGKERRYVWDDSHQRAGQRALVRWGHGDDDVVLVPHVKGIRVGVAKGRWHVERADSVHLAVFCHVIVHWAQQTV